MGDIIELETPAEKNATYHLMTFIERAYEGDNRAKHYLSSLWDGESWNSIKNKLEIEGNTWYVWWMDGVRQHLANLRQGGVKL